MGPAMPVQVAEDQLGSPEYLSQLMRDKRALQAFPNTFLHIEKLLDEEIARVRSGVLYLGTNLEPLSLPEPLGSVVTLTEKLMVPVKEYPDFNFVGRLLGPRGMTAKQLELDTGCRILVRGQGSLRDKKKEEQMKGKAKWEHLSEDLHVLITVEDTRNRANLKIKRAVEEVKKLLVPSPEGEDELKKRQLMELALINGTYKGFDNFILTSPALGQAGMFTLPFLRPDLQTGAPIFLPPPLPFVTGPLTPLPSPATISSPHNTVTTPLVSSPGDSPGFFYHFEPCLLSPTTPPMIDYPHSPITSGFKSHIHPLAPGPPALQQR